MENAFLDEFLIENARKFPKNFQKKEFSKALKLQIFRDFLRRGTTELSMTDKKFKFYVSTAGVGAAEGEGRVRSNHALLCSQNCY